jgi:Cu2+-exporting ATPase
MHLSLARNLQAIIFDKTGTLTKGEFGITDIISFDKSYSDDEIMKYAATVESESEHPIAKGIVKYSKEKYQLKEFNSIPGKGAEGKVNGKEVKVVSPGISRRK